MRRMWTTAGILMALAVLAVPAMAQRPGHGPGPGPRMGPGMMGPGLMARNPAEVVLKHRDELELTSDQVQQVEAIRDRVEAENAPRIETIMDAIGDVVPHELSIEERYEFRQQLQELKPIRDEIRATNRAAGRQIHELLNDDQERKLMGIMHANRPGRGQHRPHRQGPRGPRDGSGPGWR